MTAAYIMLRHTRWRKSTAIFVIVFVPLVLIWFSRGAVVEVFSSMFAGGVLVLVLLLVGLLYTKLKEIRASRLSMAPDPYLEEAEPAPAEEGAKPEEAEAPADDSSETPKDSSSGESAPESKPPEKASGEGEETQEGRS
jgi:hypothetical protein